MAMSTALLNMECSEEDIYTITGYDLDWKLVGRRLLNDQKVRDIDREGSSEREKRDNMLLEWKRIKSRDATYQALVKVLRAIENNATADRVEELERKRKPQGPANVTAMASKDASSEQNGKDQEAISEQPIGNTSDKSALGLQIKKGPANETVMASKDASSEHNGKDQEAISEQLKGNTSDKSAPIELKDVELNPGSLGPPTEEIVAGDIIFNYTDLIGEGAQGCVYKALWKSKQKPVAVKNIGFLSNAAKREIETLKSVRHKNIVAFHGVYEITDQRFCLVLELACSSLDQHLKRSTPSLEQSLNWAEQVGQGMHYLHNGAPEIVIHGDLKSSNVLVYSDEILKIGDFGSSKFKNGQQSSVTRMTIGWKAPELFDVGKNSMESDVYAFGILLWEMVTHEIPYKDLSDIQILKRVTLNQRPEIPPSCNETLKMIIQRCWDSEPNKRPTFKTVLKLLQASTGDQRDDDLHDDEQEDYGDDQRDDDQYEDEQEDYGDDQRDDDQYDDEQEDYGDDQRDDDLLDDEQEDYGDDQRDDDPFGDEQEDDN